MEFKVKVEGEDNEQDFERWMEKGLREQLLGGAVGHILKELTPDRMRRWVEEMFAKAMSQVGFYDIEKRIREAREPYVHELLSRPDIQQRIKAQAAEAVEAAITGLPDAVKEEVGQMLKQSLSRRWQDR